MKNVAIVAGAVAIAVFATAAVTGNAGVNNTAARDQAHAASLQKQINELRSELICAEAATGDGLAADGYQAQSAAGFPPKGSEQSIDDHGVCKKLGVTTLPSTSQNGTMTPPFKQLVHRAFG